MGNNVLLQNHYQLVVIGGGPAGLAAAYGAAKSGVKHILLLDRNERLGGVLPQCIHDGFGIHLCENSLTGPEYAEIWQNKINDCNIEYLTSADVLNIDYNKPFKVECLHSTFGKKQFVADSIILAVGCRERTLGQMRIPGSRPAGIYTAGAAQYMMNVLNYLPGKSVVILGSGDIGLIMARRLTLEGITVKLILGEKASGLVRNHVQCVQDFDLPILFGYTLLSTHGFKRLKGVTIAPLLSDGTPDLTKKTYVPCDTLLLATGLIPETELWQNSGVKISDNQGIDVDEYGKTPLEGVFACGNVNKIYDLVDNVSLAGIKAGKAAAKYILNDEYIDFNEYDDIKINTQSEPKLVDISAPEYNEKICILCPKGCKLKGEKTSNNTWKISGNGCSRGLKYGKEEFTEPKRILTTTVKVKTGEYPLVAVKSVSPIPKKMLLPAMKEVRKLTISAPIKVGDVICNDLANTGISLIACNNISVKNKNI